MSAVYKREGRKGKREGGREKRVNG